MLQTLGAHILSADEIARELMQPGTAVYAAIAKQFRTHILNPDATLNRAELARLAFAESRIDELNAIVHPATIAEQEHRLAAIVARQPNAIIVVESALIFETAHGPGWRSRFDRLILVTASDATKISRFIERSGAGDPVALEAEARRRLTHIIPDEVKAAQVDFILHNDGTREQLQQKVTGLWNQLAAASQN